MPRRVERSLKRVVATCTTTVIVMASVVACSSEDPLRHYSDEELGLDEIVDREIVSFALPFARYRTFDEMDRDLVDPTDGAGHERERNYFEHLVALVMGLSAF